MIAWALWGAAVLISFAALEAYRLKTGGVTLSRFVWSLTKAWPPLPLIVGAVIGFVSAHWWWGGALICY